jgi:hypothetical protein
MNFVIEKKLKTPDFPPKTFEDNPRLQTDRQLALNNLDITLIDEPLLGPNS